jgi:gas vesicle protein
MKSGKVFLGMLAGASAGALLGILFAPSTGKDTRKKIANTSKEYADTVKKQFDKTLDDVTKKFKKVQKEVSEFAHHAKAKEEKLKQDLKQDYGVQNS